MKALNTFLKVAVAAAAIGVFATSALAANIAVVGGSNDDAFWNKIKKGLDDATPAIVANGGSVNYLRLVNYDNFAPDVVQLIRTAISHEGRWAGHPQLGARSRRSGHQGRHRCGHQGDPDERWRC